MQTFSRLPPKSVAKRHSGRTLYAKAQSEPYAREENTTAAGLTCHLKEAVRARNSIGTGFSETAQLNNAASCECLNACRRSLLKRKEGPADSAYHSGDMLPKGSSALSRVSGHCDPTITPVDIQPCVAVNCESIAKAPSTSVS